MKISRRDFIHAGYTAGLVTLTSPAMTGINNPGAGTGAGAFALSQRSVINLGFLFDTSYPFINHYLVGDSSTSPVGSAFTTGTAWPALIDANGWPNQPGVSGTSFGGSVRIAGSDEYTGKWVITWDGDGTVNLSVGTWTVDVASSTNYVQNANGRYSNVTFGLGSSPRVVVTLSAATGPQLVPVAFLLTDPNGVSAYIKNFKFYRLTDETDLLAGKVFRAGFKQPLVNLNPSAIRFLNWHAASVTQGCRFENRTLPTYNGGYGYNSNWNASPVYAAGTTGASNAYTLATSAPTTANPKTTPVSYQHGEVATVRFTNAMVRGVGVNISAITNANPGKVTTASVHGYSTGDKIVHINLSGMGRLNYFPVTITVVDTLNYTIGVDTTNTTNYPVFVSGQAAGYISIDVGARGARPIHLSDGRLPAVYFGNLVVAPGYYTMVFDKNLSGLGDGVGGLTNGVWLFSSGFAGGLRGDVPIEIMTTLINEVNALSVSQGISGAVSMWLNMPYPAMMPGDPDYVSTSDYAVKVVNIVLNGANGYAGLVANAKLFIEYGNETWNSGGGFSGTFYLGYMGSLRYVGSTINDFTSMYTFRTTLMMRSLKAAYPGNAKLKYVLSGQGAGGFGVGSGNYMRVHGNSFYNSDPSNTWGTEPIANHDMFATATYFDPAVAYFTGTGVGTFPDDSALYNGTAPYAGAANPTQAITNFVTAVTSNPEESIYNYLNLSLIGRTATFAAAMLALGKTAINYEGGTDWEVQTGQNNGGGIALTANDTLFSVAVINSTQWRDAQIAYFNRTAQVAGSAMPSVFTFIGNVNSQRWSYCKPDSYVGTTEGQALLNNPTWVGMGSRNQTIA